VVQRPTAASSSITLLCSSFDSDCRYNFHTHVTQKRADLFRFLAGTDISVFATIDPVVAQGAVMIGFELDGVTQNQFTSTSTGPVTFHNRIFYQTGLTDGRHSLRMTANENTQWFFDYIVYGSGSSNGNATNSNGNATMSDGNASTSDGNASTAGLGTEGGKAKKGNGGAGGVIGALLGLIFLALLIFFFMRRRRNNDRGRIAPLAERGLDLNRMSYGDYKETDDHKSGVPIPLITSFYNVNQAARRYG
jgi:hypothetical protein